MFKNLNNLVAICDYFRSRNCDLRAALLSCNGFCWVLHNEIDHMLLVPQLYKDLCAM